uniref:Uncharacterized protein n=1 Tax=Cynoglossus semilaevis TaxID=244447 RepID=A0A3P8W6I7_CYNSE
MAFRKALKHTVLIGGGAAATFLGLSQLIEYKKTQVNDLQNEQPVASRLNP